jgi:NSS family neurotransmitter:Na+ symporter
MMPALYIILIGLVIYAAIIGDFAKAFHFLFDFDSSKITTTVVIAAMGHAFFTLALGAGAMLMYGAYVPKGVNLVHSVLIVSALDVLVAFLSGLAIFPIVFADHLAPNSGPGLMFVSLPITFAHMEGGSYIGGLFFVLFLFAAWTASLNLAEPLVNIVMKFFQWGRTRSALLIGFVAWFLGIGSLLSFNVWKNVKFFHQFSVFDVATNVPTDFILPLGGLGFAIFAGWIMKKAATQSEVPKAVYPYWRFLVRYVASAGILVVFISSMIG